MILSRDEFLKYSKLPHDKNYSQLFKYFVRLLRRTRLPYFKNRKIYMSAMQTNMVRVLSDFQEKARAAKKKIREAKSKKDKSFAEKMFFIYKEWIRIIQTIADGIAWRSLKFNRPLIRLMSENKSTGHINKKEVDIYISYLNRLPYFVIINDLTRCLRTSDLTQVLPDGKLFLYEIKKSGDVLKDINYIFDEAKKHNRPLTRQELKQWVVQSTVIDNKIKVPVFRDGKVKDSLKAEIINCDINIKNHFPKVKKLIKEASKKGCSQSEVEDGYFVRVTAYDKIKDNKLDKCLKHQKHIFKEYTPEWVNSKKDRVISLSNYESFRQEEGQYTRNILPYSVLPFSSEDCVRLMMGQIFIKVFINLNIFKRKFKEAGWNVQEPKFFTKSEYQVTKKMREIGDIEKYEADETLYHVSRNFGEQKYYTSLPFTLLMIMMSSFYGFDFLIDSVNFSFKNSQKDMPEYRTITFNYLGEQKILL